jgi:surfeit locus 1 family protein
MKRGLFAGALVLLTLGFIALGVWQVERRAWKLALIARVDARIHAPVQPLWDIGSLGPDKAYIRVSVNGVWLGDRQTFVQALTEEGAGDWVITPLQTDHGLVLINRGFIPDDRRDAAALPAALPGQAIGLVRASEPGGGFLRANDPANDRWYSRDVDAIGRARGLSGLAPVFIDADAGPTPGGYPQGGLTVVTFRNAHLTYALTWFGLAGLCLFGLVLLFRPQQKDV